MPPAGSYFPLGKTFLRAETELVIGQSSGRISEGFLIFHSGLTAGFCRTVHRALRGQ